ncbi:MAG: DUF2806 domain-containing protein [Alphaproteobacteria bacterium]|nr:DUF2806 domain-containing protein [Alphaproteobacteria bacterium]
MNDRTPDSVEHLGTAAGPSAPVPLGLPKPESASAPALPKPSPTLTRLNDMVVSALGTVQREWLRGLQHQRVAGDGDHGLADRAAERSDHVELRRQLNVEAVLQRAVRILPATIDEGAIDPDWGARFFAGVADTADVEMARLWARLLVSEVRRPGAVTPVVVARLPGLSVGGLRLFKRFAAFAINNFVVRLDQEFFERKDVTADQILLLEEYGLVRTNRDLNRVFLSQRSDKFSTNLLYADKALRITHPDANKQLTLACYRLTEFGTVLGRALLEEGEIRSDTDYIVELVRTVQRQGFQTAQADILERADEQLVSRHSSFCDIAVLRR